jgi:hypothetical protein
LCITLYTRLTFSAASTHGAVGTRSLLPPSDEATHGADDGLCRLYEGWFRWRRCHCYGCWSLESDRYSEANEDEQHQDEQSCRRPLNAGRSVLLHHATHARHAAHTRQPLRPRTFTFNASVVDGVEPTKRSSSEPTMRFSSELSSLVKSRLKPGTEAVGLEASLGDAIESSLMNEPLKPRLPHSASHVPPSAGEGHS